ncbi:MAG: hypothetical protein KAG56_06760 [Sulfurovaceae bacterium]|nr:hypothetical protein [Sulfurovaceae bacterium]
MSRFSTLSKKINGFFTKLGVKRDKKENLLALLPVKSAIPITNFNKQSKKEVIDSFNKLLKRTYFEKSDYISFVTHYYKDLGYTVWEYRKEKKLPESEIHLVIKKKDDILLIQCHNEYHNLDKKNIENFEKQSILFVEENQIFQNYNIKLIYIMSTLLLEESAYGYIKKSKNIYYQILKENIT